MISGRRLDSSSPEAQAILAQMDWEKMELKVLQEARKYYGTRTRSKPPPSPPTASPSSMSESAPTPTQT